MLKITDKVAALRPGEPFHSLEFFPPKTTMGFDNLEARLRRMACALRPLFVNVTWGAGGSTATKSLQLAELCQRQLELTTCLHLTCTNMSQAVIDETLEAAKEIGIRNILALRGDPPRNEEYSNAPSDATANGTSGIEFEYAVDLVKYIREKHGDYFCIGVAAYPEGHVEGACPERQDVEFDIPFLVEKVKAGADFIMTQLFYDVDKYLSFEKSLRDEPSGVFRDLPIIPGMMPIQSFQMLKRITKLSGASIPPDILTRLEDVKGDDEGVKREGVNIVSEIIEKIKSTESTQLRGFHFYTLNLEKAVSFILERTNLIPAPEESVFEEIDGPITNGNNRRDRRSSSVTSDPHNRVIIDSDSGITESYGHAFASEAGFLKPPEQNRPPEVALAISEGEGSLGREATWDDYPNGRFGNARSPAFGEIDGYGPSLHLSQAQAVKLWSYPVTTDDISALFVKHIRGELEAIPWSEQELSSESKVIQEHLIKLNTKGRWTVASQPAVNAAKSTDELFGWGPKGGFVFQKAFVEFFCSPDDWTALKEKLDKLEEMSYYAANKNGDYQSNVPTGEDSLHAVTWGVFPGKEIITPTIIEEVSFKAWKDEAFSIWNEWGRVYPSRTASSKLISEITKTYYLVNIIHHGYLEPDFLWEFLEA
ncbi:MTHFR-domain-containing protein [Morchella conica CCBAS932]|uniref:MTHFR-domain-containing protein n=1 Tax=Morchella conica CCBAS932 TaxID=1392247 RepID=A0A3N4KR20_9PEZI|nr:MTHFR-domain-containing protein [Morchella conica CCBAS932]